MRTGVWKPLPIEVGGVQKWMLGRAGTPLVAIAIHRMLGTLYGTDNWFRNPASGMVSTHFGVGYPTSAAAAGDLPTVYQWVDTQHTAWGWAARPTDRPTPTAEAVFGNLLRIPDLNRAVIHVEVANYGPTPNELADWYAQPWKPNLIKAVDDLVRRIRAHHGHLPLLGHADVSTKLCPGSATPWTRIGGYGITQPLPDTSQEEDDMDLSGAVHQEPKVVRIKGGATLYKQPTGDLVHWVVPAGQAFDADLFMRVEHRYLCRRVGGNGAFFVGSEAFDDSVEVKRYTLGGLTAVDVEAARKAGFVDAKTKARIAVEGIGPE